MDRVFLGIEKSVAVMDGDGSQMLRGRMGTETMSDGAGWGWIQLLRYGDGLIFHYRAGLYSKPHSFYANLNHL